MEKTKIILLLAILLVLLVGAVSASDVSSDTSDMLESIGTDAPAAVEVAVQEKSTPNMDVQEKVVEQKENSLNGVKNSKRDNNDYYSEQSIEKSIYDTPNIKREANTGTFTQLTDLINQTQEGSIIELDMDYEYDGASIDGVSITKSITIDGHGYTLNGKDSGAIMDITAGTIVLKNIIFTNASLKRNISADLGAAIYNDADLTVINCTFTNNNATNMGGAIYSKGNLVILDSTFINNHAKYGGAIENNVGNLTINNSTFIENSGIFIGAIDITKGNCTITNSTFEKNTAMMAGAVYDDDGILTISDSIFTNNSASIAGAVRGGTCINCTFTENSAVFVGGALSESDAINSTFIRNHAETGGAMSGGNIINCEFIDNEAEEGADTYNTDSTGTFEELSELIDNTPEGDVLELDMNYGYYGGSVDGIQISKSITIDGKGHTINGKKLSRIFTIVNGNLTLKNVTIANANEGKASVIYSNTETIINIVNSTLINNKGDYLIYIPDGFFNIADCEFYNNAPQWEIIYCEGEYKNIALNITNSTFNNPQLYFTLDISSRDLNVINCTFENAEFVLSEIPSLNIVDSTFNCGDEMGIYSLMYTNGSIINNTFTCHSVDFDTSNLNVSYNTFIQSEVSSSKSNVNFSNIEINDFTGKFNGALSIEKSNISITDSSFANDSAERYGGAIYFNQGNLNISDTVFDNNSAGYGGALMIMNYDSINIENNTFKNNHAIIGGAVYSFYEFNQNNTFIRNSAKDCDDVYQFTTKDSLDSLVFRSRNYTPLQTNITEITELPSYYNLNDDGYVTPVKDQGYTGTCVTFAAIAALESAILKANNTAMDLSENNMKNLIHRYSIYGQKFNSPNLSTATVALIDYLTSWMGPVLESEDEFDENSIFSVKYDTVLPVQNMAFIGENDNHNISLMKKYITEYGGIIIELYMNASIDNDYKQYINTAYPTDHNVCIVGWDDDMEIPNAPSKGAWIVKNSYGTDWGYDGYFYLSYYDTQYNVEVGSSYVYNNPNYNAIAIIFNDTEKYDKNYQYELGLSAFFNTEDEYSWYKNVFYSTEEETLAGISTFFEKQTDWQLYIYLNDELTLTQTGTNNAGYYTIKLDEYIPLQKDDKFEVVFKILTPDTRIPISLENDFIYGLYRENLSYVSNDGENWQDLTNITWKSLYLTFNSQIACIKAFTILPTNTLKVDTTEFTIGQPATIQASIYYGSQINTTINKGKITFKVNGKTLKDADGKVIYAKVVNGTATIEDYVVPSDWAKENTTIQAVYSGSSDVAKMTSDKETVTINTEETTITTNDVTASIGDEVKLTATINSPNTINTGKVVFKINGKTVKDSNGKVIYAKVVNNQVVVNYTVPADMKAKSYNLTAVFISSEYERIEDTKTLTVI